MTDVAQLSQLGFAALMAILLWGAYRGLVSRLLEILNQNSLTLERITQAVEANTRATERLSIICADLDQRLTALGSGPPFTIVGGRPAKTSQTRRTTEASHS